MFLNDLTTEPVLIPLWRKGAFPALADLENGLHDSTKKVEGFAGAANTGLFSEVKATSA